MANNHETLTGLFTDIADAIREKTGGTEPIVADQFPTAISEIETCPEDALFLESETKTIQIDGKNYELDDFVTAAYGNGVFVALGCNNGYAIYSTDGITWTNMSLPFNTLWADVIYVDGKFVALSQNGKVAYSTDGITWAGATITLSADIYGFDSIAYGDGKFVALGTYLDENNNRGSVVAYSTDGISWQTTTVTTLPCARTDVAYGDGKFVATYFDDYNIAAYSVDGITWQTTTLPVSAYWIDISYGNGRFVMIPFWSSDRSTSNTFVYSDDGITWQTTALPVSACWKDVTYCKDKFIAFGEYCSVYSADGITWTEFDMPDENRLWALSIYGNNTFVAVSNYDYDNEVVMFAISNNGINWTSTITNAAITNVSGADVTEETVQATKLLDSELATQDDLIAQIAAALEGKSGTSPETAPNVVSISVKTYDIGYGAVAYYVNNSFELVELQATANAVQIEAVGGIVISRYEHKTISGGICLGYIYLGAFIYAFHSNDGSLVLYSDERIES